MQDERPSQELPTGGEPSSRNAALTLAGVMALAVVLRVAPLLARNYVGDADQGTYLQLSSQILQGSYPTGNTGPGFGAVVALCRMLGVPFEWSGRVASFLLGLVVVLLAFAVARKLYGLAAGLVCAFLLAVHAAFVDISMNGVAENALLVGLLAGLLSLLAVREARTARAAGVLGIISGLCFGYAYLVRPDGFLYGIVFPVALFLAAPRADGRGRNVALGGGLAVATLVACLLANTLAVHRATGEWRPQQRGLAEASAHDEGSEQAVEQALYSLSSPAVDAPARSLASRTKRLGHNVHVAYTQSLPEGLDPLLMALAGFGLIALLLVGEHRWRELTLSSAWLVFPALSIAYAAHLRHLLPLVLIALFWAASGICTVAGFGEGGKWPSMTSRRSAKCVAVLCGIVLLTQLKPNIDLTQAAFNGEVPTEEKVAGRWLKDHAPADSLVLERKSVVAFYAGMRGLVPPPSSIGDALTFAAEKGARYLIVSERRLSYRPFLKPLLDPAWSGSPKLRRVYETPVTKRQPQKLVIYEFTPTE